MWPPERASGQWSPAPGPGAGPGRDGPVAILADETVT